MTKKLLLLTVLSIASAASFAQSTTQSGSTATGTAAAQGGSLAMDSHAVYNTESRFATATAIAPALTSSNDTCMGSSSAGAQGMSFGVSVGSTWEDKNCKMLKNSRELWNMGMRGAAIKLLCTDPDNRFALESTGIDCGETKEAWELNGEKVAVAQRPVQVPAQPQVVGIDPKAVEVERHAVAIIQADQKAQHIAAQ